MLRAPTFPFLIVFAPCIALTFAVEDAYAQSLTTQSSAAVSRRPESPVQTASPMPTGSNYHIGSNAHSPAVRAVQYEQPIFSDAPADVLNAPPVSVSPSGDWNQDEQLLPTSPPSWNCPWEWQCLPGGILYRSYLAGPKESRFATAWLHEENRGWYWDATLGGRVGILRYGPADGRLEGYQLDIEGAAFPRLDIANDRDVESVDFRFGIPLTWRQGPVQLKVAYYHLSSHVGDEYLARVPSHMLQRYSRDAIVWGMGYFATPDFRVYGEAGYSFCNGGDSEPWELQFGAEYSPARLTGNVPDPFFAINGQLREEVNFGGGLNVMTGAQWRSGPYGRLFRIGLQYYNGQAMQFAFSDRFSEFIGLGMWYDY